MIFDQLLDFLADVLATLRAWNARRPRRAVRLVITPGAPTPQTSLTPHPLLTPTPTHGPALMATILTIDQQLPSTVHGLDAAGATVTTFGSVPAWSLADAAIGALTPSPDGLSCTFIPAIVGDHVINASALAQVGDPVPLTASLTVSVTPAAVGVAVSLVIVPGDPVPKAP